MPPTDIEHCKGARVYKFRRSGEVYLKCLGCGEVLNHDGSPQTNSEQADASMTPVAQHETTTF